MFRYILKRIINSIFVLIGVVFVILSIIELAPGSPARVILGLRATPEQVEALNVQLGYDRPFLVRFLEYIKNLFTKFDLGISYKYSVPVREIIQERIVPTLIIVLSAIILVTFIAIIFGSFAAKQQNKLSDKLICSVSGILSAVPGFFLAILLLLIFACKLKLVPVYGVKTWTGYVLPVITVSITTSGSLVKLVRSVMLDAINQDYVRTARAYGEKESHIIAGHVLKNVMMPIVTNVGYMFAGMLGGTVIIENVFSINGLGKFIVESISTRDIPAVCGTTVVLAIIFCAVQLIVDISYLFIDARVKAKYGI